MKKLIIPAFLIFMTTGCFNTGVRQFDSVTGKLVVSYRSIGLFNNQATKGLRVDQTTKSGKTLLGTSSQTDVGDVESIKAASAGAGTLIGEAAKVYMGKP